MKNFDFKKTHEYLLPKWRQKLIERGSVFVGSDYDAICLVMYCEQEYKMNVGWVSGQGACKVFVKLIQ